MVLYSSFFLSPAFHLLKRLTMGKPDRNPIFFGLCHLLLLLALVHGGRTNARYNWIFFIPIFILSIYSAFFCAPGSTYIDYVVITSFLNLIPTSSDYILLRNRQPELRKIGQKKATSEMTFKERLMWALSLLATPRGIGWAHEPTDQLSPRPTASRRKFITSQFLWFIFYAGLGRVVRIPVQGHPSLTTGGPSTAAFGWRQRTMVWAIIVSAYCSISGAYAIASIITVAVGLCEPRDWPHIFGSPLNAYTLRKCWGYVLLLFSAFCNPVDNCTVASGTRFFARSSRAIQIFLQTPSVSRKAHSRPTLNSSQHSSSLESSTNRENACSSRIALKKRPFNFFSSKQLPSRSKMRLLLSPRAWDIRNPKPPS